MGLGGDVSMWASSKRNSFPAKWYSTCLRPRYAVQRRHVGLLDSGGTASEEATPLDGAAEQAAFEGKLL